MSNNVNYRQDEEHASIYCIPQESDIVKSASLVYYAPYVFMPSHVHSVGQFSTLLCGQAQETNINGQLDNGMGVSEFKPVAYKHSNQIGTNGAMFLSINLDSEHEDFVSEFGNVNWQVTDKSAAQTLWNQLFSNLLNPVPDIAKHIEPLVLDILTTSLSTEFRIKKAPSWLLLAEQALHESEMSAEQIAADVGVHRVHLSRVFRAYFCMSLSQYRQRLALQKSIAAILTEEDAICSASAQAGFADQSHLTRVMKKQLGTTPNTLKKAFNLAS